jgi:hypothetical protein
LTLPESLACTALSNWRIRRANSRRMLGLVVDALHQVYSKVTESRRALARR